MNSWRDMKLALLVLCIFCLAVNSASAGSIQDFQTIASGTVTYYGPPGCETTDEGCTFKDEGTVEGKLFGKGTFSHTAVILWKNGFSDGSGGYCAPASGVSTSTASDGSTLTVKRSGLVCNLGTNVATTFNSAYFVIEGTKRFKGATGSGIKVCSVDSNGNVLSKTHGVIHRE